MVILSNSDRFEEIKPKIYFHRIFNGLFEYHNIIEIGEKMNNSVCNVIKLVHYCTSVLSGDTSAHHWKCLMFCYPMLSSWSA